MKFNHHYFLLALFLFGIEVLIATYINDRIIRPYFGDFLVVILLYCILKSFVNIPHLQAALFVLLVSFVIEILQYFHFVKIIGLGKSRIANLVLGNSFEWFDFVAYTLGIGVVIGWEYTRQTKRKE